ncbi:MAG: hypothetical protein HZC41_01460 [Chloroflexi bacterium]|nr:hypothetical protein [Chloroflexota bacterium]
MKLNRRQFLTLIAGSSSCALLPYPLLQTGDWGTETPAMTAMREYLESVIGGLNMALDFRCIHNRIDEQFRIQINAFNLMPVASCFKAWAVLYYLLNTPPEVQDTSEFSPLYQMAVNSDNVQTGVVLMDVAERVTGRGNALEKFNNFLTITIGMANGLHSWNWPGSPTAGLTDPRFAPSAERRVYFNGVGYEIDNAFWASDLARGYDFLIRGETFTRSPELKTAIQATRALLSIRATNYNSPIERAYPDGFYMGKDGILPSADTPIGRVVNDAGLITIGDHVYLIAFMSAGESESTALDVLKEVVGQMVSYEQRD